MMDGLVSSWTTYRVHAMQKETKVQTYAQYNSLSKGHKDQYIFYRTISYAVPL
jgi:hypothetical protein